MINLLLIKLLGVAESGAFFYDIAVCSFIILFLSWSIDSGFSFYASKNNHIISTLIGFVIVLIMAQGLICWIVLDFIKLSISRLAGLFFIIGNIVTIYFSAFLYALKRFRIINIITCCINFVIALLLLYCLWFKVFTSSKQYYMAIYIAGIVAIGILVLTILLVSIKKLNVGFTVEKPLVKNILSYSSIAFLSNIITFLVTRIDYFFVQKYCSSISLSNYIQVSKFGQLLLLIPLVIASIVFPLSSGDNQVMTLKKVQQLCRGITIIFVPAAVIIFLTAHQILPWFYGKEFNQMYIALLIYLPGSFAISIITILAADIAGKKHLKINLVASIVALTIIITGDLLLIPTWGINAAAAVSSAGYIAGAIYLLCWYQKVYNCKISDFIFFSKIDITNLIHRSVI